MGILDPVDKMGSANAQSKVAGEQDKGGKKTNVRLLVGDGDVASMSDFSVHFSYRTSSPGLCASVCL